MTTVVPATSSSCFCSGSLMEWEGTSLEGRTDLHVLASCSLITVNRIKSSPIVTPYASGGFLLVQDNALPRGQNVKAIPEWWRHWCHCLALICPRPESNENFREFLHWCTWHQHIAPQTDQELTHTLIHVWKEIPKDTIHHPIRSISRCRPKCIQVRSGF